MDRIIIENLTVFAYHGVLEEEKKLGQKFIISAEIYLNLRNAGVTDNLNDTLNYAEACEKITEYTKTHTRDLIEAAAEDIATLLLIDYPIVEEVKLTLRKPWAPVGLPVDCVGVSITRRRHVAYIALGSNMGDKKKYLNEAVQAINSDEKCSVNAVSDFIVTEPVGGVEQDDFLNGCMEISTLYTPNELLNKLHEIEHAAGRERKIHWGPRTLDLDIIFYDDEIVNEKNLKIPHIELENRYFVLKPLCDIAPHKKNPVSCQTVANMLKKITK